MIRTEGLAKAYGAHRVLDGVDLSVEPGERVALLGLNGAGKTTFMRCLLGLTSFDGRLEIGGLDVRERGREVRAGLGYVPQRAPHFEGSLGEVVEFFARLRGLDPNTVSRRLESLGLAMEDHEAKPVRALSGGMLQKVLLALALVSDVPLLLLDEPTANLDAAARREFLRSLAAAPPRTSIVLASHRLADVEAVADRLLVLHQGRLAFDGRLDEIRHRVETGTTFWVQVEPGSRDRARAHIESRFEVETRASNAAAIGVDAPARLRADVLVSLRDEGIAVESCWTESRSLSDLLGDLLGEGERGSRRASP